MYDGPYTLVRQVGKPVSYTHLDVYKRQEYDCAPTADELFSKCEGARYLTKLDLRSSFWQIPIRKEYRKYTAFQYKSKCYQHRVVPFGLSTSLVAIVKCLERALGSEVDPYTIVFVDDILVVSKTLDVYKRQVNNMFRKIKKEVKKCYECQTAKGPNLHTYVAVSYTHLDVYKRQV